jgi:hypothetical protein
MQCLKGKEQLDNRGKDDRVKKNRKEHSRGLSGRQSVHIEH